MEALELACPAGDLLTINETLGAKEALVEGVVELLADPVSPGLALGDEHRDGTLVQRNPDDLAEAGRAEHERLAVIQLQPSGYPQSLPGGQLMR